MTVLMMIYAPATADFWAAFLNGIKIKYFYPQLFPGDRTAANSVGLQIQMLMIFLMRKYKTTTKMRNSWGWIQDRGLSEVANIHIEK